jgi:Right handed beta helix region
MKKKRIKMKKRSRISFFGLAVLVTLVISAMHPMMARADDGTPVAPSSPAAVDTSAPAVATQAAPATDISAPPATDPAVATQAPAATDTTVAPTDTAAPATDAAPSATDTTAALSEVPTGTAVIVVDATGTAVPLASQAAADIIATGDPIWCPSGVSPVAGSGGCTTSYSNLTSLVSGLSGESQPTANGTIWISSGTDSSSSAVTIDGSVLTAWAAYELTLQGGWNGGGNAVSTFSVPITISNWGNDVTVNDINVTNSSTTGLTVTTNASSGKGNITVHHVNSSNNTVGSGDGLYLNNSGGTGNITLTDIVAEGNASYGLQAYSQGNITLSGVTADYNTEDGAVLNNEADPPSITVTNSHFDGNDSDGLVVFSAGNATLNGVTANGNHATGALLKINGNIAVNNSNFSTNSQNGLVASTLGGDITVTNSNFSTNSSDGLQALSRGGDINITNITASGNVGNGIFLDPPSSLTGTITCSVADDNGGYGVSTEAGRGTLTLNGDTLSGNTSGPTAVSKSVTLITTTVNCNSGHRSSVGGLPLNIVNVTGGESNPLDCTDYGGTELVLPNGDHALLPCPNGQKGTVTSKTGSNLPSALDSKYTFISGFDAEVTPALSGSMTVSFTIPAGKQGSNFAIMHWDGTKWVNLGGSINPPSFFSVQSNLTGEFILVTQ